MNAQNAEANSDELPREGAAEHISWRICGETAVISFRIDHVADNVHAKEIGDEMLQLAEGRRFPEMIIDFAGLELVPSSLLARLITLYRRSREWQGRLKVCGLGHEASVAFRMLNLHKLMPVFATADDAMADPSR